MKTQRNESKRPAGKPSRLKNALEILLVIAVILLIPLFFAIRSQAGQTATASPSPVPVSSVPPTRMVVNPAIATATPTFVLPTAAPAMANGKEPPSCTFPLAQKKTAAFAPVSYKLSDPQAVLTALKGNNYHIIQWLPDNQRVLITEDLFNTYVYKNDTFPQQSISLYDVVTGASKVYAIRSETDEPPAWNSALNAVVYPATNYTSIDKAHGSNTFTRQVWVSNGDPKATQKLADNLSQFPLGVKPDGTKMIYRSGNKITGLDKSLNSVSSVSFDPTQWDYSKEHRYGHGDPLSFSLAWQPGTSLVFLYSDGAMGGGGYTFILNTDTGQVCELNLGGWSLEAHWSLDGRYLAFIRSTMYTFPDYSADLAVLDAVTGNLKVLNVVPQEIPGRHPVDDFVWAPDNRHLLAHARIIRSTTPLDASNLYNLYLVDFISEEIVNISPAYQFYATQQQSMAWSPDGSKVAVLCPAIGVNRICLISVQQGIGH